MHSNSVSMKVLSLFLGLSLSLGGAACLVAPSDPGDVELRTGTTEGFNTLVDPLFGDAPLQVDEWFLAADLGAGNAALATSPGAVFQRNQVVFGARVWNRVAPGQFVLAGSQGEISIKLAPDASALVVSNGQRHFRLFVIGDASERLQQAGFITVAVMSGASPGPQVHANAGPLIIGVITLIGILALIHQDQAQDACEDFTSLCNQSAQSACSMSGGVRSVHVECSGEGGFGSDAGSTSSTAICRYTCNGGGGGGGGGGDIGPVTTIGGSGDGDDDGGEDDAGEAEGDEGDEGDEGQDEGDNGADDDDDGGEEESEGQEDSDGCGESWSSFSIGSVKLDGGIGMYAASDDSGDGGDDC